MSLDVQGEATGAVPPEEWRGVVRRKLEAVGALSPCDRCGGDDWRIADGFVSMNTFRRVSPGVTRDDLIGGVWFVFAGCPQCANVKFFDARVLGLDSLMNVAERVP